MRKVDAFHALARLSVSNTKDPIEALSEATRIVEAATGSRDVRVMCGDAVTFHEYPLEKGKDFFGMSVEGMMLGSQEVRKLGRAAVHTVGRDGLPHGIAPADGRHAGAEVGTSLWIGDSFGGDIVAFGPWSAAAAQRAGRFLEAAAPSLAIMLERVNDAQRAARLQQQMSGLANVAGVFTRAENMEDVLDKIVSAINSATGFLGTVDLLDSRGQIVTRSIAASRFTGTPLYDAYLRLVEAPDPVREMILEDQQPVVLPDLQNDPRIAEEAREFYRRTSLVSAATIPLLFQDEVVGLLRVASLRPTSFDQPVLDLLRGLALQAAVVVKGVELREELRRSEEKFRDLVENISEVICTLDKDGRITYVSPAVEQIAGYSPAEVVGRSIADFIHPDDFRAIKNLRKTVPGIAGPSEGRILTRSGETRWVRTSSRPILNGDDVAGFRVVLVDITDRKQAESQIKYLAYHDSLTGLPNRTLLSDRLAVALAQRHRDAQPLAVIFLDLDRFKLINDTVGHAAGDEVLQRVAERLTSAVREGDTVARMGGDEFTVLLPAISGIVDACEVAERIIERLTRPLALAGHEFHLSASLGIAMYPEDGDEAETLLRNADTAMYWAKDRGKDRFQLFTAAMNAQIQDRISLESDLRHALDRGEITVYYQPQVNIESGQIMGMEALARWQHPRRGLLLPVDFIPLAEETGLILPIGEWVLHTSCAQCKAYQEAGLPLVRVAVNLSSRQFQDPGLVAMVTNVLKETGLQPDCLDLEITEGTAMRDVEFTVDTLRELRGMGVHVSIDDFGTGYSSLAYMSRFPVDSVKIDGSFVSDAPANPDDAAIVTAIIALARTLNLRAVAEGVETKEQLAVLLERQCHEGQGYFWGEPVPAHIMAGILAAKRPLGATPGRSDRSGKAA